jgi:3-oxoacyl-[acyl-carrier protein] reductase
MNLNLKNKRALVCGSTQGIGKAASDELALLGAHITLIARNEDSLKKTLSELSTEQNQNHHYLVADFSQPETLSEKVKNYISRNGSIHILVNNTGGPAGGPIMNATIEEFKQTFSNHLICNHLLAQAVLPGMKESAYGRIINVISTSVKQPIPGLGVSNTIRAAVANWSKTLAGEVGQFGITVNNVLPGATKTIRLQSIIENKALKSGVDIKTIEEEMLHEIPLKRFASPEEIASAIAFLASPAAAYINGINISVDGGRTACL